MSTIYSRYSDNLARGKTCIVDSGVEDTSYLAANLVDGDVTLPAKLTGFTGRWRVDMGASVSIDVVALINHNLYAEIPGVTIGGNDDGNYANPLTVANKALVIPAWREDGMCTNVVRDISDDANTARYWFLNFANANDAPIAIGELWLGSTARTLDYLQNPSQSIDERRRYVSETVTGTRLIYDHGVTVREFSGGLTLGNTTDKASFVSLVRDAHSTVRPWLFWPNSAVNDAMVVRFMTDPQVTQETPVIWRVEFEAREVSMGVPL